jgi:hypothetical protein
LAVCGDFGYDFRVLGVIETRQDLARHLQAQMVASRGGWSAAFDDEERPDRTLVKTYLVEAHCGHTDDQTLEAFRKLARCVGFDVAPAKEPGLFHLASPDVDAWCDTSLGRFWRMHTTSPVKQADPFHDRLVSSAVWLDKVWIPPDYLESLATRVQARMLTFSLSHDRRPLHEGEDPVSETDFVTMRLWSSQAEQKVRKLRAADVFPHGVSVRSVRLLSGDDGPDGSYCVAEYFHHGKITAGGTSFDEHTRLLVGVLRDYRALVERFEERFGLAATTDDDGHPIIVGAPVVIRVEWTVPDLEFAVSRIFASSDPFRLWGMPERVSQRHYRVRAVDLNVGGVLSFDVTPNHVVIQLPRGVCGNTVVRFLNNLRFHVNSDTAEPQ